MTREELISSVAEQIMVGATQMFFEKLFRERTRPLIDESDTIALIRGDRETRLDILSRVEKEARELVVYWLTYDPRGIRVIEEAMEQQKQRDIEESL